MTIDSAQCGHDNRTVLARPLHRPMDSGSIWRRQGSARGGVMRDLGLGRLRAALILCAGLSAPVAHAQDAASHAVGVDIALRINADHTGEILETRRIRVEGGTSAPQRLGQQTDSYIEGMQDYALVEAYTLKSDGRRVEVDRASVITRDAAHETNAVYLRDVKAVTILFADVARGDTLVMTTRKTIRATVFPGQFQLMLPLPRSVPYADSTIRVRAPASVGLAVGATGFEHAIEEEGEEIRHVLTYRQRPVVGAEERMTSALDRDPRVSLSTFADYEHMARAYWAETRAAIATTPEIRALADEITRGIADKAGQAAAISRWIKTNLRYVNVQLGSNRVVPNHATAVLRNRFGDCKDHAVLMSSLLAAKGIAFEHVLINAGNAYTLPEPATLGFINHVLLYLPELGIYEDPTVALAALGGLNAESYDKPVLHMSDAGVRRARTPPMSSDDHVSVRRTRLVVAADGAVSGDSVQTATGVFAIGARSAVASLQWAGLDKAAETTLRNAGTPGRGRIDIGAPEALEPSYEMRARFSYDARLPVRPQASAQIPTGLGTLVRPGAFLFAGRLPGRRLPFTCFAGRQIEEIAVEFAAGLPLPEPISDRRIETAALVYTVAHRLEGRTMTLRRELVSRVSGQVCPPETEAEIASPLAQVAADNAMQMRFAALPADTAASQVAALRRAAVVGEPLALDFVQALDPACATIGVARVAAAQPPGRGTLEIERRSGFVTHGTGDPRAACNHRRVDGVAITYRPEPGYQGPDSVTIDIVYADGSTRQRRYAIAIGPVPEPRMVRRAAVAGQRTRVGFIYDVERDCASLPFGAIRVVEPPRYGEATIEPGTGFPAYERGSLRAACNDVRTQGADVVYRSVDGHVGEDSLTVEIVHADGRQRRLRYAIDVK
jgi:transglutaminase-like putative cysteine protease